MAAFCRRMLRGNNRPQQFLIELSGLLLGTSLLSYRFLQLTQNSESIRASNEVTVIGEDRLHEGLRSAASTSLGSDTAGSWHRWKGEIPGRWP